MLIMKTNLRVMLMLILLFAFLSISSHAQAQTVSGKVVSAEDGAGLPGVNVVLQGTTIGTVTDIDGNYTLDAPSNGTLVFSFIGFTTQQVAISNRSVVDVQLSSDIQQLSEVVVTALGIVREERSLGYSTQEVGAEELNKTRESNVVNALSGKVAGVQITGSGGTLGGSSRITIRGINSISGNNQPLFVVDGVPMANDNFTDANQRSGRGGYDYG